MDILHHLQSYKIIVQNAYKYLNNNGFKDNTDLVILGRDVSSVTFTLNEDTECLLGFYVGLN